MKTNKPEKDKTSRKKRAEGKKHKKHIQLRRHTHLHTQKFQENTKQKTVMDTQNNYKGKQNKNANKAFIRQRTFKKTIEFILCWPSTANGFHLREWSLNPISLVIPTSFYHFFTSASCRQVIIAVGRICSWVGFHPSPLVACRVTSRSMNTSQQR